MSLKSTIVRAIAPVLLRIPNLTARRYGHTSYSQCGEDSIVDFILKMLKIQRPTYIDIGAHHPWHLSNTARLYEAGCRGINIEPDPGLIDRFRTARPRDINLNCGISGSAGTLDFHVMDPAALNTFSASEAQRCERAGHRVVKTIPVPVVRLAEVIAEHARGVFPDFLTIDVEGLEMEILRDVDFARGPKIICIETLDYSPDGSAGKRTDVMAMVDSLGYDLYADTRVNSIYIRRDLWHR